MNRTKLDTESSDLWARQAELRWGKYVSTIETNAVKHALSLVQRKKGIPKALDIGCESGRWTKMMLADGFDVTSTDICPKKLAACRKANPAANCIQVSVDDTKLPVEDNSVDLVVCVEVEVSETDWFIPELTRILRESGVVVFTLNNHRSYRAKISRIKSWLRREEIYYQKSYGQIRKRLVECDFEVLHEEGFCWLPFGRLSDSRLIPPLVAAESFIGLRRFTKFSPWVVFVGKHDRKSRHDAEEPMRGPHFFTRKLKSNDQES